MRKHVCGYPGASVLRTSLVSWLFLCSLYYVAYAQTVQEWTNRADAEPDPAKAEQLYTKAIELNRSADPALLGRAIVRGRLGRYPEAIGDASAAIGLNQKQPLYYAQRAYLLVQLSEYDDASSDYEQAIQLSPQDARFYSGLSYCRLKQNRLAEALKLAQRGIDLAPESPFAYRNRGRTQLYTGHLDDAIADFQRSLARRHTEPHRVLTDLGEAFERKKDYVRAADYYRQALLGKPGYVEAEVRLLGLARNGFLKASAARPPSQSATGKAVASTFTGKRVALVIGNSQYLTIEPDLKAQPEEDAREMDKRLKELGFSTILRTNTDADALQSLLNSFYEAATQADLVVFFFAGHGLQYNGANYLLPTDIELYVSDQAGYVDKLNRQALLITTVIERLQKCNPRFCLIILDACREDPLKETKPAQSHESSPAPASQNRITPQPFAPIVIENFIRNCCVAQATTAGSRAWNGPGRNGCYTEALLRHLQRGSSLEQALKRVRNDVLETSKKAGTEQRPEFLNQTTDDLIF